MLKIAMSGHLFSASWETRIIHPYRVGLDSAGEAGRVVSFQVVGTALCLFD